MKAQTDVTLNRIPTGFIRWLMGNTHVGTDPHKVADDIVRRAVAAPGWTIEDVDCAVGYALEVHHQNYADYQTWFG